MTVSECLWVLATDFIPTVSHRLNPARLLTSYLEAEESWAQRAVGPHVGRIGQVCEPRRG